MSSDLRGRAYSSYADSRTAVKSRPCGTRLSRLSRKVAPRAETQSEIAALELATVQTGDTLDLEIPFERALARESARMRAANLWVTAWRGSRFRLGREGVSGTCMEAKS